MSTESIRERLAAATPGPWSALTDRPHFVVYGDDDDSGEADVCEPYLPQDAAFIAASRTDVELLLAVAEAIKARPRLVSDCDAVKTTWVNKRPQFRYCGKCPMCKVWAALDALEAG